METKKYTLAQLAELTNSTLKGDPNALISGVDSLDTATSEDASFLANPRYRSLLATTKAGAVCVHKDLPLEEGRNYLLSDDPSLTFQQLVKTFIDCSQLETGFEKIHPTAVIHPTATIASNVHIGPYAVIDKGVTVQEGTRICAHVSIGPGVSIGSDCLLHPHSSVREGCTLGNRVILQPGAVIGSCGFGYITDAQGRHHKLEQVGGVILEDDVEVGANTTIDRGRFKPTCIKKGTKLDNLVQIGHNVCIGESNIIVSQTGIAGSSKTGKNVVFGGQAGVVGHVEIADYVMVATRGGVSKSVTQAGKYAGGPLMDLADYNRQQVHLRKITDYVKRLEELEKRLEEKPS